MVMEKIEYRYYEMPPGLPALALTGERWEIIYGSDNMHFHNHLEIGYCHYGEGTIIFEDKEIAYKSETITFIPSNIPHHTKPVVEEMEKIQKWEFLFLDMNEIVNEFFSNRPEKIKEFLKNINRQAYVLEREDGAVAIEFLKMIFAEIHQKKEYYKYAVKTLALNLLLFFSRLDSNNGEQEKENRTNIGYVNILIKYMEEHYMEEIDAETLVKNCNWSESYIRRLFLEYVNATPMEYLRLVRIDKSCELLAKTEKSVEIIAKEVGYPAVSTYMRNFKKITGMSPAKWRKEAWRKPENIRKYHISVLKGW